MKITINLTASDLQRIRNDLGITSYDDIYKSIINTYGKMLDKIEGFEEKMIYVKCLDDDSSYGFNASTAYEAMEKMLYTLNQKRKDDKAVINKTNSGLHLWFEHSGKTYAARI